MDLNELNSNLYDSLLIIHQSTAIASTEFGQSCDECETCSTVSNRFNTSSTSLIRN